MRPPRFVKGGALRYPHAVLLCDVWFPPDQQHGVLQLQEGLPPPGLHLPRLPAQPHLERLPARVHRSVHAGLPRTSLTSFSNLLRDG